MFSQTERVKGTFYEERPASETLSVYLRSQETLYDRIKNQQIERLLAATVPDYTRVLEIGCGGGAWTHYFVSHGAQVTAVEKEHHLIAAARLYLQQSGLPLARVKFTCSDALAMDVEEKFDLVFVKDMLEHVHEDGEFVRRLAMSLTPHGMIFFSTQNAWSLNYVVEGFYQRYLRGNKDWMGWDPTHVRFYTYPRLKKLLQAQELEPVRWIGTYHLPYRMCKMFGQGVLSTVEATIGRWFHAGELIAGDRFPVNVLGWNIGVLAKRARA